MPDPDHIVQVVREWVQKAENDLTTAAHTLKLGSECPTDAVCFHAQQCVEKYLKAILVLNAIRFPKTHDIEKLMALLPNSITLAIPSSDQKRLSAYAVALRYPDFPDASLREARHAVAVARRPLG